MSLTDSVAYRRDGLISSRLSRRMPRGGQMPGSQRNDSTIEPACRRLPIPRAKPVSWTRTDAVDRTPRAERFACGEETGVRGVGPTLDSAFEQAAVALAESIV